MLLAVEILLLIPKRLHPKTTALQMAVQQLTVPLLNLTQYLVLLKTHLVLGLLQLPLTMQYLVVVKTHLVLGLLLLPLTMHHKRASVNRR